MMILRYSQTSPFARKILVVAQALEISGRIQRVPAKVRVNDPELFAQNPLGQIPVLITEEGIALHDSKVICEYLNMRFGNGRLLPPAGTQRWQALTAIHLADGMIDAGLLARQEDQRMPPQRCETSIEFQLAKVKRALEWFNAKAALDPHSWLLPEITLACALEWLSLRLGTDCALDRHARLANWYADVKTRLSIPDTIDL